MDSSLASAPGAAGGACSSTGTSSAIATATATATASGAGGAPSSQAVTSKTAMSSMVAQRVHDSEALLLASYVHLSELRTDVLHALDGLAHAQGRAQGHGQASMSHTGASTPCAAVVSRSGMYVFQTPVYGRVWESLMMMAAVDVEGSGSSSGSGSGSCADTDVHTLAHNANASTVVSYLKGRFFGSDLEHLQVACVDSLRAPRIRIVHLSPLFSLPPTHPSPLALFIRPPY
jgi:hypothetical protein